MNYSTLREKIYVVHKQNKQFFLTLFFWTNTEPGTDGCIYQVYSLREDKYWPRTALDLCGFRIYLELYYNVAISLNGSIDILPSAIVSWEDKSSLTKTSWIIALNV